MPELPEVETVARQLAPLLTGKTIRAARVRDRRLHGGVGLRLATRNLRGWVISQVTRCGKQIVLELVHPDGRNRWLVVHLRMTGRLLHIPQEVRPPAGKPRLLLLLDSGSLGFYDLRRFGTVELHTNSGAFSPRGLDPLSPRFGAAQLAELIGDSHQAIKAWLLRQDRLVGLGNIYACEVLFRAGIDPTRRAESLNCAEVAALSRAIKSILKAAIRNCGTTFSDFQDSQGRIGGYQRYLRVYSRDGQPCPHCGGRISRAVQQQRSTYFCPTCQN